MGDWSWSTWLAWGLIVLYFGGGAAMLLFVFKDEFGVRAVSWLAGGLLLIWLLDLWNVVGWAYAGLVGLLIAAALLTSIPGAIRLTRRQPARAAYRIAATALFVVAVYGLVGGEASEDWFGLFGLLLFLTLALVDRVIWTQDQEQRANAAYLVVRLLIVLGVFVGVSWYSGCWRAPDDVGERDSVMNTGTPMMLYTQSGRRVARNGIYPPN